MSEVASLLKLSNESLSSAQKIEALKVAILQLNRANEQVENVLIQRSGSFIVSLISTGITISGFALIPPIVGAALLSTCVVSAVGTLATITHELVTDRSDDRIRKLRIVLGTKDVKQWAHLWSICDTETFLTALDYACQGDIENINGRDVFRHYDNKHPFDVANAWILASRSTEPIPPTTPQLAPTSSPPTFTEPKRIVESSAAETVNTTPTESESSQPSQPFVLPKNRDELIIALRLQCPALLRLVKSHPIRAVGVQRSGKTTLVKKLSLLRMVLLPNHTVIASTPHYEPDNPYPNVFRIVGLTPNYKRDYPAIRKEWNALASRIYESVKGNTTTIWDEFGVYGDVLDEEELGSVLTSCLRETMKFGEYPIFIVHGETQAFLPGSKGIVTPFLSSTVRVETIGEIIEGEDGLPTVRPTGKFRIEWLDRKEESGRIPDWLTEELLLEMVGSNPPIRQPEPSLVTTNEQVDKTPTLSENVPVTDLKVSDALSEPLRTIWLFAKERNDWITAKEVYQKSYSVLKGKGVREIHQLLGLLADTGYGEIDEEGKSDSAVAFRAY